MKKELAKTNKKREVALIDGNEEEKVIKKTNKKFWKILSIACITVMVIVIASCILDIFRFFYDIHPYGGYAVLVILLLLLIIFVIRPIAVALGTPCFTLDAIDVERAKKVSRINYKKLRKVAKNLLKSKDVSMESKEKIKESMGNKKMLTETLKVVYKSEINKEINKIINSNAAKVLACTAISQNSKFDAATVILLNIRMIMQIVVKCGYHPSYAQLSKLIVKVFRNALIAYSLQSLNLEDVVVNGINKLVKGAITAIPGLNEVAKSLTQGAANALLSLRIGIITRKYLYKEYELQAQIDAQYSIDEIIVNDAIKEADDDIDDIIAECKKSQKKKQAV